jgi:shikimate kinase
MRQLGSCGRPVGEAAECRVILIGMMGSGKTTIGQLLAQATGWTYVDNDELVRRRSGSTARQLLASEGRSRLREVESEALALGLELPSPVIVGVAAGTVLDEANRARLRDGGVVVWLRAPAAALIDRAMDAAHRPFVDRAGSEWLITTTAEREPLYREMAQVTVDTGTGTPEDAVRAIREHLAGVNACKGAGTPAGDRGDGAAAHQATAD